MTKLFQNKMVLGIICIVLSAILSFVILPGINKNKGETVKVIKLKTDITAGTPITEEMIEEREVGSYGLPQNTVKDKDEIVGKFASVDIMKDDLILSDKISEYAANARLDEIMEKGQKLVTVSLPSIASGVGNYIIAGDIVSVAVYKDGTVTIPQELRNLEVFSVQNDDAVNLEDGESEDIKGNIASTVTLIATDAQAQALVSAEYSGKLHIVFEKRGGTP